VFCEKKKCWYRHGYVLPLLFALLFILAFASALCPTASAEPQGDGCTHDNWYNGTVHGDIYFQVRGHYDSNYQHYTYENVPDNRTIVRLYPGIWLGSPSIGRTTYFNLTINGHTEEYSYTECHPYPCCNLSCNDNNCNVDITGYGVCSIRNVNTSDIKTDTNNISFWTDEQIYHVALLVVYENESMPEIQYWVKEGQIFPSYSEVIPIYEYFNETVNTGRIYAGSLQSVKLWLYGHPHCVGADSKSGYPVLNGNDLEEPDYVYSYDAQGNVKEGLPPGKDYTVFARWDNIPPDYITRPSNLLYFPNQQSDRLMAPVLMLKYSEASELNVTDISPESLCVDYYNTIDATIVNAGGTASFNATLYANNTKVDVRKVTNLGKGESRVVKFLWEPSSTGPYELNVTADVENVVKETDKTNNSKTLNVEVKVASPPEGQSPSSNVSSIPSGGTIELRAQGIANVGLEKAILATDENEAGTWENVTDGRYGSPMNMASYYNYSLTHTTESDWKAQTLDNSSVVGNDVKLYRMLGTTNLALNQPAYSTPYYYPPGNAVDGTNNFWLGNGVFPEWWYVDLGAVKDVQQIKIIFGEEGLGEPYDYTVDISNNATDWTTKIQKSMGRDETYDNLGWSCQYIRVSLIEKYGTGGWAYGSIEEFEAYGPGDYKSSGTLTSSAIERTDNPIVSITPSWNSTEPAGTNLSVNVSVDNGVTWKNATNGTELTWDYDLLNNSLKYKVLFKTTNLSRTPVLHDITLNYTTKDPIESEWLWSNFSWHNASIPNGTTVGWKIYYEDMLGQTNCTAEETFYVGEAGDAPNVVVTVHNVSFGNMLAGDNTTIYISLTLNNSEGTAAATIEAVFKSNVSVVYGLNGTGSNIIPGNNFELGRDTNEKALTNTTTKTFISTLPAGENVTYNAILIVPAGQAADDYSGIVELSW
jgi:hypothetical protein